MVRVTDDIVLPSESVTLYHSCDPLLGEHPVLVFHGPSTTANYTHNSSRVQVHVFSAAGFQSFHRLTISPNSPFYTVVDYLPREFQGDEVYRGLAFGLFKYFSELPESVKLYLRNRYANTRLKLPGPPPVLFGEQHAADLAKELVQSNNTVDVVKSLQTALQTQHISNVDLDFVLPPGSIVPLQAEDYEDYTDDEDDILDPSLRQYGGYTPLVRLLGESVFLPTSRLRRAPSKPTSLNRGKAFSKDQKFDLRMKLCELVDTEQRYVKKVNELVNSIAADFRKAAQAKTPESQSPTVEEVDKLFPESLDTILNLNTAFMHELRKVMDDSEEEAQKDMEHTSATMIGSKLGASTRSKDPSGALAVARLFLEWFPKFTESYQDYIRASQNFPQMINGFMEKQSTFKNRVGQAGEQTIRSSLIEPVQRLPRYSLLIDQIVACLPITHPALQPMLRARDIITNICSMDDPLPDKPYVANRLRNMVEAWPESLVPQGRIIMAADFIEIPAPVTTARIGLSDMSGMFLVFADCVVLVKKQTHNITGRDFLRELDKPSAAGLMVSMTNAAGGTAEYDLLFMGWHDLADVRFTESDDGQLVWMTSVKDMKRTHVNELSLDLTPTSRCFRLQETFEGKANRWTEDIAKARVEGRFAEAEREDPRWTLRSIRMPDSNLGLFAAVFQEGADYLVEGRKEPAPIRVVIDHERGTKGAPIGHYGVDIVVNVGAGDLRRLSINAVGLGGKAFHDEVALEDFLPTLSRRIIQLMSSQLNVWNPNLVPALVSYYTKTVKGLNLTGTREKSRSFLATSPVKLLSNIWNGTLSSAPDQVQQSSKHSRTPVSAVFPSQGAPSLQPRELQRSGSQHSIFGSIRGRDRVPLDDAKPENPLVRLEGTFTGYVAALQQRKGNILGRAVMNRGSVDELAVNDLYNRLIEAPFDFEYSSDLGADVILVAFEKFLRIAWTEQMGPIMTMNALDKLQARLNRRVPGDFADFVNYLFGDMAPQNRRAFTSLIKLLADLLDGCGNDSDRGALTLAFAEILVPQDDAANYMNLLDRLVEDCDRIFDESGNIGAGGAQNALLALANANGYLDTINGSGTMRGIKSHSGSLTSNTSSLRRKFGFDTLLRQNSKDSTHSDKSIWRSFSKHGKSATDISQSNSTSSRGSRTRSVDLSNMGQTRARRPLSRDRPPVAGAFEEYSYVSSRPPSSHRMEPPPQLETIGEPVGVYGTAGGTKKKRTKRRSSLSDLRSLMATTSLDDDSETSVVSPPQPIPQITTSQTTSAIKHTMVTIPPERFATIRAHSPSRIPVSPASGAAIHQSMIRPPRMKENIATSDIFQPPSAGGSSKGATPITASPSPTISDFNVMKEPREREEGSKLPQRIQTKGLSNIPTLKPRENLRPNSPTRGTGQRLRLQSPQRLRERLQSEKQAAAEVDASLKSELSKITEDMARVGNSAVGGGRHNTPEFRRLAAAVRNLEEQIPTAIHEVSGRHESLQRDMEMTMKAHEAKVVEIDTLYQKTALENKALYDRFNTELVKIVKAVKGKGREDKEELLGMMTQQGEEVAKLRKDNLKLKRELASLRAAVKGLDIQVPNPNPNPGQPSA
ncbi:hypothetical protein HOO65_020876 [Ceratocystis lukuohia]|uniref:DH domain-containing protein n=1 Tax=Ceratocystis lukuohia TaxID=2019550 RepID=A0ABR4MQ11_9PEZI